MGRRGDAAAILERPSTFPETCDKFSFISSLKKNGTAWPVSSGSKRPDSCR